MLRPPRTIKKRRIEIDKPEPIKEKDFS